MRKPAFCICENKDADQLRGNREANQRLCFRYTDSTIPLLSKSEMFKPLAIFCDCPVRFVGPGRKPRRPVFSQRGTFGLVCLMLNVPVHNFSVMLGRSHSFLGITSTFLGVNMSCSRTQHGDRVGLEPPTSGSGV